MKKQTILLSICSIMILASCSIDKLKEKAESYAKETAQKLDKELDGVHKIRITLTDNTSKAFVADFKGDRDSLHHYLEQFVEVNIPDPQNNCTLELKYGELDVTPDKMTFTVDGNSETLASQMKIITSVSKSVNQLFDKVDDAMDKGSTSSSSKESESNEEKDEDHLD